MALIAIPQDIHSYPTVARLCGLGCTLSQNQCVGRDDRTITNLSLVFPLAIYDFYATGLGRVETMSALEQWCLVNIEAIDAQFERAAKIKAEKTRLKVRFLPRQHIYRVLGARED